MQRPASDSPARRLITRVGVFSATLLVVMLPALLAFLRIDQPVGDAERARVATAVGVGEGATVSATLLAFYQVTLPANAAERWPAQVDAVTRAARRSGMLALLCVSLELYLLLMLTRGRTTALLACASLCLLPALRLEGYVLRPEQPALMFTMLAMVLLVGVPQLERRPPRYRLRAGIRLFLALLCAAMSIGLAVTCLGSSGLMVFLPGTAAMIVAARQLLFFLRFLRRRPIDRWPVRAASTRLLPWVLLFFMVFGCTLLLQSAGGEAPRPSVPLAVGLWPEALPARLLLWGLAAVGAVRMLLGVGLRLGRQVRLRADLLLLLFCLALLLQYLRSGDAEADALVAVPAVAILFGEGLQLLLFLVAGRLFARPASS